MYKLLKRRRNPFRSYGGLILAIMLATGFWVVLDVQAGPRTPGWFAGLRSSDVWCHTKIQDEKTGGFTFISHYPNKSIKRVVEDLGAPPHLERQWTQGERTTECFDTWRAAALEHPFFVEAAKGYEEIIMGWPEANFERTMHTLAFAKGGKEILEAALFRQAEELRKEKTQP